MRKTLVIVAYDIRLDTARERVSSLLMAYGVRVNYSVYEIIVSREELKKLKDEIRRAINKKRDSVLFYSICQHCYKKKLTNGRAVNGIKDKVIVI